MSMEANPMGATDVDGAASRLSSMLNPERSGLPTETSKEEVQEAPEKAELDGEAVETPEGDTEAEEPRYKVKVGGEEKEVTLDDLRKGYMMESDYRRKTSDVSKQREALEAKSAEIEQQLAEAKEVLEFEIQNLESPEMQELKEFDPQEYLKQFEKVQRKVDKFNKLKAKRQAEQAERQKEIAAKEYDALVTAIPEWIDESVRNKEANEVFTKLRDLGFSDAELANMSDHRMFVIARKAMMLDRIKSQDIEAKKVKTPPKTQQPGTAKDSDTRQNSETKALRARVKQTGNMQDAAKLLRTLMK